MYQSPYRAVVEAFHGKPPRIYMRMLNGHPSAWGSAARAPREQVQTVLRSIGLEMRLVTKETYCRARPGKRRGAPDTYVIGELVSVQVTPVYGAV